MMWARFSVVGLLLATMCSCRSAQTINPQALAHQNACIQSLQVSDYESAKTRCELCLEYDETVPECINGLGLVAFARGDDATAIKHFQQSIHKSRDFAQARNNLGAVYFKNGDFSEAITLFKAAVEIDPGYQDARYNLALSYLRIGQKAFALSDMVTARSNFDIAKDQFQKVIGVNATYVGAHRDLGLLWTYFASMETLEQNRLTALTNANRYFDQCLAIESANEQCHQNYGSALLIENRFDTALHHFAQCLAANRLNSECVRGMDEAYQGSQIKSKALQNFISQIKRNPQDAQGHYGYCKVLFDGGLNDLAVAECKTAVELNPKLCPAYFDLGMHYKEVQNPHQAYENCRVYLLCTDRQQDLAKASRCEEVVTTMFGMR